VIYDLQQTELQMLFQFRYIENHAELVFRVHRREGPERVVIKQGTLNFDGFYDNVVYKHDVQLRDAPTLQILQNYYSSSVELQFLLESPNSFSSFSQEISKNMVPAASREI